MSAVQSKEAALFENLVNVPGMLELLKVWLKQEFHRVTIYRWVKSEGMPCRKIRGKIFFVPSEVAEWLERTS
jgi:predicted DNA-binding transcriptional regulator AlpA